jgi:Zn-dependent protease with chaperone function
MCAAGFGDSRCFTELDSRQEARSAIAAYNEAVRGAEITLAVSSVATLVLVAVYVMVATARKRRPRELRALPPLPLIPATESLVAAVNTIANSLNLRPPEIRLQRSKKGTPSVSEDSQGAILVIPTSFLVLFASDPDGGKAVIAHELGHLVHKDSWIYYDMQLFRWVFNYVVFPVTVLVFVVSVGSASFVSLSVVPIVWAWKTGRSLNRSMVHVRHESELRADRTACDHADGWALIRVLNLHIVGGKSKTHPDPETRVQSAEQWIQIRRNAAAAQTAAYSLDQVFGAGTSNEPRKRKWSRFRPGQR